MKKLSLLVLLLFFVSCKQDKSLQNSEIKKDTLKTKSFTNFDKKTNKETTEVLDFFLKNKTDALKHVKYIYYKSEYFNYKENKKDIPGHMKYSNYFVLNDYETTMHQIENIKKDEKIPHLFSYKQIYIDRFEKKYKVNPEEYWQKYEKVFGKNGFATMSKPLFSKNLRFAYIEISIHCGELCGEGLHYFLEKKENNWVIIEKGCDWVS
jgi:hypothetical protein